jgi:hypothetical protein
LLKLHLLLLLLQAFAGLNLTSFDAATLLSVVSYHFCPGTKPWVLVVSFTQS